MSAKPTVALHADSKTGSATDETSDTTPKFTVGNVKGNSTVTVRAEKSGSTVAKTVTVGASATSVDVEFSGNTCGSGTEACGTLAAGEWAVKAVHDEDGATNDFFPVSSDVLMLNVDTAAPTVTVSLDETSIDLGDTVTATFTYVGGAGGERGRPRLRRMM